MCSRFQWIFFFFNQNLLNDFFLFSYPQEIITKTSVENGEHFCLPENEVLGPYSGGEKKN